MYMHRLKIQNNKHKNNGTSVNRIIASNCLLQTDKPPTLLF